jgi:Bromodomain
VKAFDFNSILQTQLFLWPLLGSGKMAGLAQAMAVLKKVMQHPTAVVLFNEPVDVELHQDYKEIITEPIDLGTILKRLEEAKLTGWAQSFYGTTDEVFKAVAKVWENALAYNSRPQDGDVRTETHKLEEVFLQKWKAAGLEIPKSLASRRKGKQAKGAMGAAADVSYQPGPNLGDCALETDVPDNYSLSLGAFHNVGALDDGLDLEPRNEPSKRTRIEHTLTAGLARACLELCALNPVALRG